MDTYTTEEEHEKYWVKMSDYFNERRKSNDQFLIQWMSKLTKNTEDGTTIFDRVKKLKEDADQVEEKLKSKGINLEDTSDKDTETNVTDNN